MTDATFKEDDDNFSLSVDALQFGVLSPDEIRAYSVCEVNDPQQFENGRPVANGPFDLRMGSITRQLNCATCHRDKETCPGHFGHIELQVPVAHPKYIEQIREILNCVCYNCSELLIVKDKEFLKAIKSKTNPKIRAAFIASIIAKKNIRVCGFCGFGNKNRKRKEEFDEINANKKRRTSFRVAKRSKPIHFSIGRGNDRFEKKKLKDVGKLDEAVVQGSGSMFADTVCDFSIQPQSMPTFDQVQSFKKNETTVENELTLHSACFGIQPKFIHENTYLYMVWPEAHDLYSFLLNGTTEEEELEEEEPENEEETLPEKDEEENVGGKKRKRTNIAPNVPDTVGNKKKTRKKKVKDATFADVKRLLKDSPFHLPAAVEPGSREVLATKQAFDILARISPENCYLLGYDPLYSHPSWFILTVLPVMPPCVRKLVDLSRVSGSHIPLDDISFKLVQLIKKNNDLAKQKNFKDANYAQFQTLVKHHVMTLIDNKLRGQPTARRSLKAPPLESLSSGLKGKGGRVRGTMLGKRVDFSSRGVVGPSNTLRSDQLGVPAKVARSLTIPETVNRFNIEKLQQCVDQGPKAYRNGANYVCTPDGVRYNLAIRKNIALKIGYVVERHLQDDDVVVFNRQPSLHRMSMMGHRAKIHDGDNFLLNLSVTTPYNADFDGDEMNCHAVQSMTGRVEVKELMMVTSQFISPQNNSPVIALIQDMLLASHLFTERDTFLKKEEVYQLLMQIEHKDDCEETKQMYAKKIANFRLPVPAILHPEPLWTGKQIISLLLPEDLLYKKRARAYTEYKHRLKAVEKRDPVAATFCDPSDTMVIVKNGELLCGVLDKASLGVSGGSFAHIVVNDHSGERARDMIDGIARCMTRWIVERGFSVGIEDMVLSQEQSKHVAEIKVAAREKAEQLSRELTEKKIEEIPGKTMEEAFEIKVNAILNTCRDEVGNYVQQILHMRNRLKKMEKAGSKGNLTNMASICGGIGQNNVNGRRLEQVYYGRSTPHALPNDKSDIEGRGFITNCYLDGLTPLEFFGHHMGGREGLVHTAVKTSDTGYIQRKLINILADLTVTYEWYTVRNATGNIVQFAYGEDAMDGTKIEKQSFDFLTYNDVIMINRYYVGNALTAKEMQNYLFPERDLAACEEILSQCKFQSDTRLGAVSQQECLTEIKFLFAARDYLRKYVFTNEVRNHLYLPKNLKRLIERAKAKFSKSAPLSLSQVEQIRAVLSLLLNKMTDSKNGPTNRALNAGLYKRYETAPAEIELDENTVLKHLATVPHTELLSCIFVHYCLSPKRVVTEHNLSLDALLWICEKYAKEYHASRVHAGEAVGPIAAQSIGEPSTQVRDPFFDVYSIVIFLC